MRLPIPTGWGRCAWRFHSQEAIAEGETRVSYVLVDAAEMFRFLAVELQPKRILAKGYYGQCDKSVIIPVNEVCFTVVCLEKGEGDNPKIIADLPEPIRKRTGGPFACETRTTASGQIPGGKGLRATGATYSVKT